MPLPYRLVALDLDGTLLNSDKEISPRNQAALAAVRKRGLLLVIATGRTPRSARVYSRQLGGGPVICCNGAAVLDESGAFIGQRPIPVAPLQRILALGAEAGFLMECYTPSRIVLDRPIGMAKAYFGWVWGGRSPLAAIWGLVQMWHINRMRPVRSLVRWASKPKQEPVLKLMVFGEPERLERFRAQVRREVPGLEISSSGRGNLEINAAGVSKRTGLELLGARLQIPPEAMIAMGDSENDLEMLEYVGLGVAMGNASDRVKAVAKRVTSTCDQDGVAHLLESLVP